MGVEGRKAYNLLLREIIQGPLLPKTKSDYYHHNNLFNTRVGTILCSSQIALPHL